MSDEPMPGDRKITAEIPQAEILAGLLTKLQQTVSEGFVQIAERIDRVEANQSLQGDTVRDVARRMTAMEERQNKIEDHQHRALERQNKIEDRQARNSDRAKGAAEVDQKHDAAIALLHTKLDENTAKTEAIAAKQDTAINLLVELRRHPLAQKIAYAAGVLVLALLGYLTMLVQRGGH